MKCIFKKEKNLHYLFSIIKGITQAILHVYFGTEKYENIINNKNFSLTYQVSGIVWAFGGNSFNQHFWKHYHWIELFETVSDFGKFGWFEKWKNMELTEAKVLRTIDCDLNM